jgi:ATP-dependent protease HslVU (ClpYQ) peptidase subunit
VTTIAYRDGVLASDSRLTSEDNVITDKCIKLWRLPDGTLYSFAGDNDVGLAMLRNLKKGIDEKVGVPDDGDFTAVRIIPKGRIYINEGNVWYRWPENHIAIGSGGKYAAVALRCGATAVYAVKQGIKSDVHSGGRVQQLRLEK